MPWTVANQEDFDAEFDALPPAVQDEFLAVTALLEVYGPMLGRPHADTLAGSKHANMKELRFTAMDGVWCLAGGVCVRPGTTRHSSGRWRQERRGAEAVLQGAGAQGR